MSEVTEKTVQNDAPQAQGGGGMSPEMLSKLEAIGVGAKNVRQTESMAELNDTVSERMNTETATETITQDTQVAETPNQGESYADQILQTPSGEQVAQQSPQEMSNPNIASEADALQASQNPSNDNEYYKLDSDLFGGEMKIGEKSEETSQERNFSGFEDFTPFIKEKFGYDNPNDFVSAFEKLSGIEQDFSNTKGQLERLQNDVNALPPDIHDAILSWSKGEDYTQVFAQKRLNYNLEPQDIEQDKIIGHYFPNEMAQIQSDEFQERLNDGDTIAKGYKERLYNEAVAKFRSEKESVKTKASEYQRQAEERGRKFNESVSNAMSEYDKKYPNSTRVYRDAVHKALINRELDGLLYNPDGTYTARAAELYVEMTQGEDLRNQLIRQAEERATSRANEQIISRQSGSPRLKGGGAPESEIRPEVQEYIDGIVKGGELSKNIY